MLLTETNIQGYSFVQANICGRYLPSRTSIEFLLEQFKDKRNKANFSKIANETTDILARLYDFPICLFDSDTYLKWYQSIDWGNASYYAATDLEIKVHSRQSSLNGCSFSRVIQSLFVINWFGDLRNNVYLNWNKYQASLNYSSSRLFGYELTDPEYEFSYPDTVEFPEYTEAKVYYQHFLSKSEPTNTESFYQSFVSQLEKMTPTFFWQKFIPQLSQAFSLDRQFKGCMALGIMAKQKQVEFDKQGERLCLCEGCHQKYFLKQKASTSNLCNSCQKKRKDEKKASRRFDRKGWQHHHKGRCKGLCESLSEKRLNDGGICNWCFLGWYYSHVGTCKNCEFPNKKINTSSICLKCFTQPRE